MDLSNQTNLREVAEAQNRLLQCAPEVLTVLEEMTRRFEELRKDRGLPPSAFVAYARTVIAKATPGAQS